MTNAQQAEPARYLRRWAAQSSADPRIWGGLGLVGPGLWLAMHAPPDQALGGIYLSAAVAFTLAGATQVISSLTEHLKDARRATQDEAQRAADEAKAARKELDETRRVCLIALATDSAEAYSSAVNALAHHSQLMSSADASRVLAYFVDQTWRGPRIGWVGEKRWVQKCMRTHVNRICELLGDQPMFPAEPAPVLGQAVTPDPDEGDDD